MEGKAKKNDFVLASVYRAVILWVSANDRPRQMSGPSLFEGRSAHMRRTIVAIFLNTMLASAQIVFNSKMDQGVQVSSHRDY